MFALAFALGVRDEPIDEEAVKLVLSVPGATINVRNDRVETLLRNQISWGRSRNVRAPPFCILYMNPLP